VPAVIMDSYVKERQIDRVGLVTIDVKAEAQVIG
jgi:hypothetical protein